MPQSSFDSTELPALQPWGHCVLIPRDPNFIYAYWDYSKEDIDRARDQVLSNSQEAQLILRVYDISLIAFNGSNANHTWDLDVGYSNKSLYIHVWQDNADYCAELGLSSGGDHFIPLMRSNFAHTPPKSTSKRNDLIWQDIKAHKESQPYIEGAIKVRHKHAHGLKQQSKKTRVYHLTSQDIREYYMQLFAKVSKKGRKKARALSIEEFLKGKLGDISWQKVNPILKHPDLIGRTHPGSSMGSSENQGASEILSSNQPGASDVRLNVRNFIFEIWTELIVHGRTEPNATVWLNQQGIKLNPDGTFSLRYALPDGKIPLKFIAQSSDNIEQRHIDTSVEREKTIGFTKKLGEFYG